MFVVLAGVVGLCIGSFVNVLIDRVPRGESVVTGRSHCDNCGALIKPYDNIPVVSWLLLRGRCRNCRASILARVPLIELACGMLFSAGALLLGG